MGRLDLSVVTRSNGSLGTKAAPQSATLNKKAEGGVATVATSAGPVVLCHPESVLPPQPRPWTRTKRRTPRPSPGGGIGL